MSDQDEANLEEPDVDHEEPGVEVDEADDDEIEILDVSSMSVELWLLLVYNPPDGKHFISAYFPTERQKAEYLATIQSRSESEVAYLLEHFLIPTGTNILARNKYIFLMATKEHNPGWYKAWREKIWYRRLEAHYQGDAEIPVWEGLTWVLDLLPKHPQRAIDVIDSYMVAHLDHLPDVFMDSLHDSIDLIRAKFIGLPGTDEERVGFLSSLGSRRFECLTERLYKAMGYTTTLTEALHFPGVDVRS